MTAQIILMNKEGIALASDSAVTVQRGTGQKIFESANKLFNLSKYPPVGIMVAGNSNFMGYPWETIVKSYRRRLEERKLDTLKEYSKDFISYLRAGNPLFSEKVQGHYIYDSFASYLNKFVLRHILEELDSATATKRITKTQIQIIMSDVITSHFTMLSERKNLVGVSSKHATRVVRSYGAHIDLAIQDVFQKLPLYVNSRKQLKYMGGLLFAKSFFRDDLCSQVSISGFGEAEPFPSLVAFDIGGIANGVMKFREIIHRQISHDLNASVVPMAQREMVDTFMEGLDPDLKKFIKKYLETMFKKYPTFVARNIKNVDNAQTAQIEAKLKEFCAKMLDECYNAIDEYTEDYHWRPIVQVVSTLPKNELAAMAEALVSLTSFKRRVTWESETVGGPIDVAVLSKGDGFVWIKRKLYFDAELNPHFIANYYRRD